MPTPYHVRLAISQYGEQFRAELFTEDLGDTEGELLLELPGSLMEWGPYLAQGGDIPPEAARQLGKDLFTALLGQPENAKKWSEVLAQAARNHQSIRLLIDATTEAVRDLPYGLLCEPHDDWYLFRSGQRLPVAFVRILRRCSPRPLSLSKRPRVLIAVAEPASVDVPPFDAAVRLRRLADLHPEIDLYVCGPDGPVPIGNVLSDESSLSRYTTAMPQSLRIGLAGDHEVLHLLAHGHGAGVLLCQADGSPVEVTASDLGEWCSAGNVSLAFLQVCKAGQTGGRGGFGGVAQQLLNPRGGNLAAVVASTFPLDAEHSTDAAVQFYRQLAAGQPPEKALHSDRPETDLCWAFLELWARPGALGGTQQRATFSFVSPYRGLSSFSEQEADLFFGRKAEVIELLQILRTDSAVAVVGDSGSGKTSLLQAGLVHAIRQQGLAGNDRWKVVSLRPGYRPAQALLAALKGEHAEPGSGALQSALRATSQPLIVVIDQFEEVFTLARDRDEVQLMIAALADAIQQTQFRLILGMRSEFLGLAAAIPQLSRLIRRPWVLRPPDREDLRSIVAGPAEHCGYTFQGPLADGNPVHSVSLLDRILADPLLASDSEATAAPLPLLQFALERLWLKAVERSVTEFSHAEFDQIGGLGMAVAQHAESVYQASGTATEAGAVGRDIAEYILTALVSAQGTRQPRVRDVLQAETSNPDAARAVVDYLVGERLLTIRSDPEDMTKSLVDLSHEVLIHNWQRLRGWLAEDPQGKAMREEFRKAAEQYETGFAGVAARSWRALPGSDVAINYLAWIDTNKPRLAPVQEEFVLAMRQMLARQKQRRRIVVSSLASLAVAACVLAFFAMASERRATKQEKVSREQSASLMLERGILLGVQGQPREGLLSIAKSLEFCPADASDLRRVIRTNLASWAPAAMSLDQVRSLGGQALTASPNGEVALLSSETGEMSLVETDTGKRVGMPLKRKWQKGQWARIVRAADDWLVLTYDTQSASVWKASTGELVGKAVEHSSQQIYVATLSPDGKTIAAALNNGEVWLWNVSTGARDGDPLIHEGRVNNLAFTPDSSMLLTGCGLFPGAVPQFENMLDDSSAADRTQVAAKATGLIRLWSMASRKVAHWDGLSVPASFVAVSTDPEGRYLAYGGTRLEIWDRKERRKTGPPIEVPDNGLWGAFDATGTQLVVALMSGKVELYPVSQASGPRQATLRLSPQGWVADAGFRSDNKSLYTLNQDGTLRVWRIPPRIHAGREYEHPSSVLSVSFGPECKSFVTGCQNGSVYLWATEDSTACQKSFDSRPLPGLNLPPAITQVRVSSDGRRVIAQDLGCRVMAWDVETGQEIRPPEGEELFGLADDGVTALVRQVNDQFVVRNLQTNWSGDKFQIPGGLIHLPDESNDDSDLLRVKTVTFSPDRSLVAMITHDGTVEIRRADTGARVGTPLAHQVVVKSDVIRALEFSSDGSRLMTQSNHARGLWQTSTGQTEHVRYDSVGVQLSRFSPDGKLEVSATKFNIAQIWDIEKKAVKRGAFLHNSRVYGASFDQKGQAVATASFDGTASIWDVSTGLPLSPSLTHDLGVSEIVFSNDGKRVLTGSWDCRARLWTLVEPVADQPERVGAWVETITGMRIGATGAAELLTPDEWASARKRLDELGGPF
jgi:WD40 repeat protein